MSTPSRVELGRIAAQLRALLETSPRSESAVEAWTENAYTVYERLNKDFPAIRLPIQVMRFVHDADIRARDPEYRRDQEQTIREIIAALEQGTVPRSRGLTLSFTTRELVVFVVALVVAVVLLVRACVSR